MEISCEEKKFLYDGKKCMGIDLTITPESSEEKLSIGALEKELRKNVVIAHNIIVNNKTNTLDYIFSSENKIKLEELKKKHFNYSHNGNGVGIFFRGSSEPNVGYGYLIIGFYVLSDEENHQISKNN